MTSSSNTCSLQFALSPQPYLAESMTPNADNTEWTIKLRPGITFHDGTPLTAEAIKAHFEGILADPLTSLVPKWIFDGTTPVTVVDELTATVRMNSSVATFPHGEADVCASAERICVGFDDHLRTCTLPWGGVLVDDRDGPQLALLLGCWGPPRTLRA